MSQTIASQDQPAATTEPTPATRFRAPSLPIQAALIAGAILLVWWIVEYWPTPIYPGSYQPGGPGDGWGGTAVWRGLVENGMNPFVPGHFVQFNAPAGWDVSWQINVQQWPSTLFQYGVTWATGDADTAMNWYLAIGVVGNAAAMAWFIARFVVVDRWIAVLIGLAFAFQPYIILKAAAHTAFAHMWPIVLMVGFVLLAWERRTWKSTAIAGLIAFVAMSWSAYHLLLAGVTLAFVLVFGTLVQARRDTWKDVLWTSVRVAFFAGFGLVLVGAYLVVVGRNAEATGAVPVNVINELYVYSARWYEYVVPTGANRTIGSQTRDWLADREHGSNAPEQALYQGVTVIFLGLVGTLWLLIRRLRDAERPSLVPTARGLLFVVGPALVVFAGICSLPPTVSPLGVTVWTPSRVLFEFVNSWRVYARFALIVSFALVITAALGLRYLAGGGTRRTIVLVAASVLIMVDLSVRLIDPVNVERGPKAAQVIKKLPPGIVAVYPLDRGEVDGYDWLYNQQFFGKPLFNGYDGTPEESRSKLLKDLSRRETIENLSLLGVRYVLVLHRPVLPGNPPVPEVPHRLLTKVADSDWRGERAEIYRVPAVRGVFVSSGAGFEAPEPGGEGTFQWSTSDDADIALAGRCDGRCRGTVRFRLEGFGPQRVSAKLNGTPVALQTGGKAATSLDLTGPTVVRVPVDFQGKATIELSSTPGAVPVQSIAPANPDTRSLSFALTGLRFEPR